MYNPTVTNELATVRRLLSEIQSAVLSIERAVALSEPPAHEPSDIDEFEDFDKLVYEYRQLTLSELKERALNAEFDESEVKVAPKDKLLKNVFKVETGQDFPLDRYEKAIASINEKVVPERDLGFANLPQLRKFAIEVKGMKLEDIQTLSQDELYDLLTGGVKRTRHLPPETPTREENYTEENLTATPRPRLASIAKGLGLVLPSTTKKDEYIQAILNKQGE